MTEKTMNLTDLVIDRSTGAVLLRNKYSHLFNSTKNADNTADNKIEDACDNDIEVHISKTKTPNTKIARTLPSKSAQKRKIKKYHTIGEGTNI